jgi:hypothetical protein
MRGEFDLLGVYLPPLLPAIAVAWGLTALLTRGLNAVGFYRFVWHRPMANLALFVLVLGGTVFGLDAVLAGLRGVVRL